MKVLVMESDPRAADDAIDQLVQAGHDVVRCHEPGLPAFPCNALIPGSSCPVSDPEIDVAVLVRARPWPKPTPLEDGVSCALRHHVPLVVAGRTILNPYDPWSASVLDGVDDIAGVVAAAASAPLPRLGQELARTVREVLTVAGYEIAAVQAEARRAGARRLAAVVTTPHRLDEDTRERIVVALHRVVRQVDPYAPGIEVEVRREGRA